MTRQTGTVYESHFCAQDMEDLSFSSFNQPSIKFPLLLLFGVYDCILAWLHL
jgi:hypothetical protein